VQVSSSAIVMAGDVMGNNNVRVIDKMVNRATDFLKHMKVLI
jgi:hypothetical protein